MKGVAFLAFLAFNAGFLPNRVEAGKCYSCDTFNCDDFLTASDSEKETRFIKQEGTGLDCSKCITVTLESKEVTSRDCAKVNEKVGVFTNRFGGKDDICEGDLCNGNTPAKCYACGFGDFGSCEEFEQATDEEKNKKFIKYTYKFFSDEEDQTGAGARAGAVKKPRGLLDSPCTLCKMNVKDGKVVKRDCAQKIEPNIKKNGVITSVCLEERCNGGDADSIGSVSDENNDEKSGSTGDEKSSGEKSGAGSLKSWATLALLATSISLLKGSLF